MRSLAVVVVITAAGPAVADPQPTPMRVSIGDAMRLAIKTSHPLAAARATTERARADVMAAKSTYFPQVTANAQYLRTLESEFDFLTEVPPGTNPSMSPFGDLPFGSPHAWRAGFDATQLIFDGGRRRSGVKLADTARRAATLDEIARRAEVVLEVTQVYYNAVLAAQLVTIGNSSLELSERTLAQARAGFEQGTAPEFDVIRSEVTRDNTRTALVRVRAQHELALIELRRLLGLPLAYPIELTSAIANPAEDVTALARSVAGIAPDAERMPIAQARTAVDARNAQISIARSARWPQLSVFTSFGIVQYPRELLPTEDWRRNWTIGVNLTYDLFTGFRTTALIRGAHADRRAAEALFVEATEQTAVADHRVRTVVETAKTTVQANTRSADLAKRAREIAEVRYRQGVSTLLELVDAQLALDNARINAVAAARDLQVARVQHALLPALPLAASVPTVVTPSVTPTAGTASGTAAQPLTNLPTTTGTPLR